MLTIVPTTQANLHYFCDCYNATFALLMNFLNARCKMADVQLVLNSPLCFLVHRLGKLALPLLKSSVSDLYSYEDLVEAKKQLMKDISDMRSLTDFPHIPDRREGEARA